MTSPRSWVGRLPGDETYALGWHDGHPVAALFRDSSGAVLRWWVDADLARNEQVNILVHLTDEEVEKVVDGFDTPHIGLLEPVRRGLKNNACWVIVSTYDGDSKWTFPLKISRKAPERAYLNSIFRFINSSLARRILGNGATTRSRKNVLRFTRKSDRAIAEMTAA